jgi:pimeloyl-ACP methyl ester carboxylesterase
MTTKQAASPICPSQRTLCQVVSFVWVLACTATSAAAGSPPLGADMAQVQALAAAACQAEMNGSPDCVDLYYRCAVATYAYLAENPADEATAVPWYNFSLGRCLRAATKHQRIDARSHLIIQTPAGATTVPIKHIGFVWTTAEFSYLIDPADIPRSDDFRRVHARCGVGAPEVVVRNPQCNEMDRYYLPKWQSFAATAILRPDLQAWKQGQRPQDTLELIDPVRMKTVQLAGQTRVLAGDFDAPLSQMRRFGDELGYRKGNFLLPAKFAGLSGIYLLEPYQPGKIPLVLVHGTQSGPLTWSDLINDLRAQPWFVQNYQVWLFTYPSGEPYLHTAHDLRTALQEARWRFDPQSADAALDEMVLAGHSQGGMLIKPLVTWSGDKVANAVFRVPFDQLELKPDVREQLTDYLFFEPQSHVKRVIYICTPFTGVTIPASQAARLGRLVIREPEEGREAWHDLRRDNPLAVRFAFRHLPTSAMLFVRRQPLHQTLTELRVNPSVVSHCIVGRGNVLPAVSPNDRVVPKRSARTDEAVSTFYVDQNHNVVHHAPETTAEIQRILCEQLGSLGRQ